ncbi:YdeI/OmpD-associated family protein [Flavobacterium amniphilum]|uniref:YdeI/OmpD-associated family protein n=1 Tax=Flavobacterium amniphilum TaxID=1834035 RepID=UPI002029D5C3|nr:YdeI/OmpD-associated family protein [Flavobacterium amniphilum]MCL9805847.1 YdeI/OmpD-associated family protein [Flavobacterium amniphilum]
MHKFKTDLKLIGINPFVFVPDEILQEIFREFGKDKGQIPIKGTVNGDSYKQTLVRYSGEWRLYINTVMLSRSPQRIGEIIEIEIAFDPDDRSIIPNPKLITALNENPEAKKIFESLPPSKQKEIIRYIASLKKEESIDRNIKKAINFLFGRERFIGQDKP